MVILGMELHSSWKWDVSTKLQLHCNEKLYMWWVEILATCSITFTIYKYGDLQSLLHNVGVVH
jgi:hypothetical protein